MDTTNKPESLGEVYKPKKALAKLLGVAVAAAVVAGSPFVASANVA